MKKILRGGVTVLLLGVMLSFSGCLSLLLVPTYQNRAYMEPDMTRVEYLIDSGKLREKVRDGVFCYERTEKGEGQ